MLAISSAEQLIIILALNLIGNTNKNNNNHDQCLCVPPLHPKKETSTKINTMNKKRIHVVSSRY